MKSLRFRLAVTALLALLFFGIVLLSVDSDVVTSRYATRKDAEKDQLFGRGWLPDFIPISSRQIVTRNNLDLNTSEGEFFCDSTEVGSFVRRLARWQTGTRTPFMRFEEGVAKMNAKGYLAYEYREHKDVWVFYVNPEKGHVEYVFWMER
ncbi:MAG: hypothetical protein B9S32_14190 [Verrucomicrobia bacterium Tous-C9LFEB]|nr:MAG: hypothetical protein B9S32_14190 [Verrucomicrobia bacterium Tous-C9LFEB]